MLHLEFFLPKNFKLAMNSCTQSNFRANFFRSHLLYQHVEDFITILFDKIYAHVGNGIGQMSTHEVNSSLYLLLLTAIIHAVKFIGMYTKFKITSVEFVINSLSNSFIANSHIIQVAGEIVFTNLAWVAE